MMSQNPVANSLLSKSDDLSVIEVITKQKSVYRFPDMDRKVLESVLPKGSNRLSEDMPTLAMVNTSFVVLTIPFRIIDSIFVDEEAWWESPDVRR